VIPRKGFPMQGSRGFLSLSCSFPRGLFGCKIVGRRSYHHARCWRTTAFLLRMRDQNEVLHASCVVRASALDGSDSLSLSLSRVNRNRPRSPAPQHQNLSTPDPRSLRNWPIVRQPGVTPDPEETPREAIDALALAVLAERAGVLVQIQKLDRVWGYLSGKREDVPLDQLLSLKAQAGIRSLRSPDAFQRLRTAIGNGFQRTVLVHYMPQGSMPLPVISTLLGPRIAPDTSAFRPLVHDAVSGRDYPSTADVGYILGHDRALRYASWAMSCRQDTACAAFRAVARARDVPRAWRWCRPRKCSFIH
jgi:hypothetical protein